MAQPELRSFLDRSFVIFGREAPGAYGRLCQALAGLRMRVTDGDAQFALRSEAQCMVSDDAQGDEPILVTIERDTLLALADGAVSIEEALRADGLFVRASVPHAAITFDALSIYLNGAIRCRSFPALLADFRSRHSGEHHHDIRTKS